MNRAANSADQKYKAIRIAAKESSKKLAREMHPEIESKNQQQMLAYREMPIADLFAVQWVTVSVPPQELPGGPAVEFEQPGVHGNVDPVLVEDGDAIAGALSSQRGRGVSLQPCEIFGGVRQSIDVIDAHARD